MNIENLESELKSYQLPNDSGVTQENIKECLINIEKLDLNSYRSTSLEWNDSVYHVINDHFLQRVKGEHVTMDVSEVYKMKNIDVELINSCHLRGKFTAKDTAILLILKNSINFSTFIGNNSSSCAVSYVEAKKGKNLRGFTTLVFNK